MTPPSAGQAKGGVADLHFGGEERDGARTTCKSCFGVDQALSFVELDARSQAR